MTWPHLIRRLGIALLLALCAPLASAGELQGVRMHEAPGYTRVVLDTTAPVAYEVFTLSNPARVVIDLKNTRAAPGLDPSVTGQDRVRGVRAAPRGADYRLVLDVAMPLDPKGFTLKPVPPYGHRLVVDLFASGPGESTPVVVKDMGDGRRNLLIAIDAGHGGEDPGAIGPGRIREKDVTLKLAKRLAAKLNAAEGYRALLVRDGDYYVPLRKRIDIARAARADLFVSLHADAFKNPKVSGASVYTLSERGASSETARWLAESENRSDLIGGAGDVPLEDVDDVLVGVLVDLAMDAKRYSSIQAGESLLHHLERVAGLHRKQVEQAGFMVLKAPDVASVLVETGYISNPAEARRLNTAAHQETLAGALFNGIRDHMNTYAPPGTLIAWRRDQGGTRYTIERGDTLSAIAVRYGTSARRIKEANGISGDGIRIGQIIVIPAS